MKINKLFKNINYDIDILGIASNLSDIKQGYLYIPINDLNFDVNFINDAIKMGASCIVTSFNNLYSTSIPIIYCNDINKELKRLLNIFYGPIYNKIKLIGVASNSDINISYNTSFILSEKYLTGLINSNGRSCSFFDENALPSISNTYSTLDRFIKNDISCACIDIFARDLINNNYDLYFDYIVFSSTFNSLFIRKNNFKSYFSLINNLKNNGIIIVNKDENYARFFSDIKNVIYYSVFTPSDYQAINIRHFDSYTLFDLITPNRMFKSLKINRSKEFNIYNIIPSIIIALKENIDIISIYNSLQELPLESKKIEKVPVGLPFDIYVDYNQTPNGLKSMLENIKKKTRKNLILVSSAFDNKINSFEMSKYATEYADMVIFSVDENKANSFDVNKFKTDLSKKNVEFIKNKKNAIDKALSIATKNDIIVVSNNHETLNYSDFDYILNKKTI